MLLERDTNDIDMGDVANEMGPPTSIGGESAFGGLLPEFCDVLRGKIIKIQTKKLIVYFFNKFL